VRKIYEALFGVKNGVVRPNTSVLVGGAPEAELPTVRPDGTPVTPKGANAGVAPSRPQESTP
jgi:hypothetical protein